MGEGVSCRRSSDSTTVSHNSERYQVCTVAHVGVEAELFAMALVDSMYESMDSQAFRLPNTGLMVSGTDLCFGA